MTIRLDGDYLPSRISGIIFWDSVPEEQSLGFNFAFACFGAVIGIETPDAIALESLIDHLPLGSAPVSEKRIDCLFSIHTKMPNSSASKPTYALYSDSELLARRKRWSEICVSFQREAERAVAKFARRYVFVHAGVVGWQGHAIVIPGEPYSGKSSLVTALIQRGAEYYSDEYAVIDARGRVHPFPRKIRLRTGKPSHRRIAPEKIGCKIGTAPLPVGLILATHYKKGVHWRPRTVSSGEGALILLAHTLSARFEERKTMSVLAHAAGVARILKGARGEASCAAQAILSASI